MKCFNGLRVFSNKFEHAAGYDTLQMVTFLNGGKHFRKGGTNQGKLNVINFFEN